MAGSDRYRNYEWTAVKPQQRIDREARPPGSAWEKVKDAVRNGNRRHQERKGSAMRPLLRLNELKKESAMGLGFDIGKILQQYGGGNPQQHPNEVEQHFDEVAQNSPHDQLADGLSEAFRSDRTAPFPNMAGQLFGHADSGQRAGMVNQLLGALGPAVIGSMLSRGFGGGASGGGLGGLLGGMLGQQQMQVRPEDVDRMSPDEFQELARHAEQENPGVVDQMSRFYAQNPTLVKALGGAALAIALGRMSQRGR